MSEPFDEQNYSTEVTIAKKKNNYFLHIGLLIATIFTTIFAGAQWTTGIMEGPYEFSMLKNGLIYSAAILFIISCHEFGHYFAARYHKVDATLPFYIPFPPIPLFLNFGTMGAVIKTRSPVTSKKAMFDIGIAGPLAGFVACLIVLIAGFLTVPGVNYLLAIHPNYFSPDFGKGGLELFFGNTLLFSFFKFLFISKTQFFPPMSEIYHYPLLCVGWFGMFITAMNMIPVGQLDGGHISYTMFGDEKSHKIALIAFALLLISGFLFVIQYSLILLGVDPSVIPHFLQFGWLGWLLWAMILFFVIKLKHPTIYDVQKLNPFRIFLGYLSFFILIISFCPVPFYGIGI
ncbi:MAG: site-2 protease family protein [Ignavibacteriaceae bacterium]|nr:site-2 protease family protein [Ignavibacteriaceae bacterium]